MERLCGLSGGGNVGSQEENGGWLMSHEGKKEVLKGRTEAVVEI